MKTNSLKTLGLTIFLSIMSTPAFAGELFVIYSTDNSYYRPSQRSLGIGSSNGYFQPTRTIREIRSSTAAAAQFNPLGVTGMYNPLDSYQTDLGRNTNPQENIRLAHIRAQEKYEYDLKKWQERVRDAELARIRGSIAEQQKQVAERNKARANRHASAGPAIPGTGIIQPEIRLLSARGNSASNQTRLTRASIDTNSTSDQMPSAEAENPGFWERVKKSLF